MRGRGMRLLRTARLRGFDLLRMPERGAWSGQAHPHATAAEDG